MITFNGDKKYIRGRSNQIREIVNLIAQDHQYSIRQIDYNFVSDEDLLAINIESLNHNFYTDIISFDYTEGRTIEGEIYISIDRVKDNAEQFKEKFHVELMRVMFHGVLHYVGYKDKNTKQQKNMREKEQHYITIFNNKFHVEQ